MPSYIVKSLMFALVVVALTIGAMTLADKSDSAPAIRNGYIPVLPAQSGMIALNHVMAKDETLEDSVLALGRNSAEQIFSDYRQVDYLVSTILLHWSDSFMLATDVRGPLIDGRIADFLLKSGYIDSLPARITTPETADQVRRLWYNAFQMYKAKLLMQTAARDIYIGGASGYDLQSDNIYVRGSLSARFVSELIELMSYSDNPKGIYSNFLVFVRFTKGLDRLNPEEKELLRRMRNVAEGRSRL